MRLTPIKRRTAPKQEHEHWPEKTINHALIIIKARFELWAQVADYNLFQRPKDLAEQCAAGAYGVLSNFLFLLANHEVQTIQ